MGVSGIISMRIFMRIHQFIQKLLGLGSCRMDKHVVVKA